jgi:hypothetical protein
MRIVRVATVVMALAVGTPIAAAPPKPPKPDLADICQGTYSGDVLSDSRGSSRQGVTFTVTKVGPNKVRVSSDYPRFPRFEIKLAKYMNTIQNQGGGIDGVFSLDVSKTPKVLDITDDQARWVGTPAGG